MYHHIADPGDAPEHIKLWFVTPQRFAEQMQWLHDAGYHTVTPSQLREHLEQGTSLPTQPIVITFDDGWAEQYSAAFPVLQRLGMTATFYVYSGGIGAPGYLTWDQLREMQAGGMVIAGHTVSHPHLRDIDDARLTVELQESKARLERELGRPCVDFAYPYGEFDERVMGRVRELGYTTAAGTEPGFTQRSDELLEQRRLRVSWHETLVTFKALVPSAQEQAQRP